MQQIYYYIDRRNFLWGYVQAALGMRCHTCLSNVYVASCVGKANSANCKIRMD